VARKFRESFAYAALDLRVSRTFRLGESRNIEIIAKGSTFSTGHLQLPNGTFGTGPLPANGFGTPTAAADPRQIQFGLRFNFSESEAYPLKRRILQVCQRCQNFFTVTPWGFTFKNTLAILPSGLMMKVFRADSLVPL